MRNFKNELKNKTINYKKLLDYGFSCENGVYSYKAKIYNNQFEAIFSFSEKENFSKLIDVSNEDEYILVDVQDATGEFVGKVRQEYENLISDIIEKCSDIEIFKSNQTKEVIKFIKEKYHDEFEFLWDDENAICRNKINKKWYIVFMKVSEIKLNLPSDNLAEIIDLRYQKNETDKIVDNEKVFPGYHMNKNSWITIKLDNTLETDKIFKLIDNSRSLSIGNNKTGLSGDELSNKVYEFLTTIPKDKVVTYGQIAEFLGNKGLSRVVGSILHKNPDGDKYPCYKVLNGKGELAEAFVFGGKDVQKKRLEKDGIKVENNKVDLKIYQWKNKNIL